MPDYTPEQLAEYCTSRGFVIRKGDPSSEEPFPYLTLKDRGERVLLTDSAISARLSVAGSLNSAGVYNAGGMSREELVSLVEEVAFRSGDRFPEGMPIRVFASGPWVPVAEALFEKHQCK